MSHARVVFDVRLPWVPPEMRRLFADGESHDFAVNDDSVALHVLNMVLCPKRTARALMERESIVNQDYARVQVLDDCFGNPALP